MNIVTTEWLNQNSTRSYPLASRGQSSRGFMLPDDLIVDVLIGSTSTLEIVLHSICFSRAITSFVFATIDGQAIGTVSIPAQSASVYQVFDVVAAGLGTGGTITVGPGIQNIGPAGTHVFNLPLEARCMLTTGQSSIHSMFVGSGKKTSGDIVFTAGGDLLVSTVNTGTASNPKYQVTLTLQNMDPYFPPCSDPSLALGCSQPAIYRINGVTPDSNGNIQINFVGFSSEISGNGFISLSVLANGTDNCSRPVMPDSSGRLPPYEQDTKPVTPYNLGPDSFIEVA